MTITDILESYFYVVVLPVLFVFIVVVFPLTMTVLMIRAIKNRESFKGTLTRKTVLCVISFLLVAVVLYLTFFTDEYFLIFDAILILYGFVYWLVLVAAAAIFVIIKKKTQLSKKSLTAVFCVETAVVLVCWELHGKFIQNIIRAVIPKLSTLFVTLFYTVVLLFGGNGQLAQNVQTDSAVFTASAGEIVIELAPKDRGISFWSLDQSGELSSIEYYMPDWFELENESSNRRSVTLHVPCDKFGMHEYEIECGSIAPKEKAYKLHIKFKVFVSFSSACYIFETPSEEFDDISKTPKTSETSFTAGAYGEDSVLA